MSLTGVRFNRWQSVENKLGMSGGWVNVCDWGRSSMWQSV